MRILSSLLAGAMLAMTVMDSAASVDERRFERMSQSEYFLMIRDGHLAWNRGDGKGAERHLLRAACAGDKDSQFMLGTMYLNGEGVEADALKAYGWYAVAAEVGDSRYAAARDTVGRLIPGDFRDAASDEAARMLATYGLAPTGQTCLMEAVTGSKIRRRVCRPTLTGGSQVRQFLVHQCGDAEGLRLAQVAGRD